MSSLRARQSACTWLCQAQQKGNENQGQCRCLLTQKGNTNRQRDDHIDRRTRKGREGQTGTGQTLGLGRRKGNKKEQARKERSKAEGVRTGRTGKKKQGELKRNEVERSRVGRRGD